MKITIITKVSLSVSDLNEVKKFLGNDITVIKSDAPFMTYRGLDGNTYGDFDWMRSLFTTPTEMRVFVTTTEDFVARGVTVLIAGFDTHDNDGVHDMYIGLGKTLDPRAKRNGFKSNLAWEIVHELAHGLEEKAGNSYPIKDRTHGSESKGDLKVLFNEHMVVIPALIAQKDTLVKTLMDVLMQKLANLKQQLNDMDSNREQLLAVAIDSIGVDASPLDRTPDSTGCVESVTSLIAKVIPYKVELGTAYWGNLLKVDPRFKRITEDEVQGGDIALAMTGTGNGTRRGHCWIYKGGERWMSNDSGQAVWLDNYSTASMLKAFVVGGGFKIYYYRLL